MIDWKKPICTVAGNRPARLICTDRVAIVYPLLTHVILEKNVSGAEIAHFVDSEGRNSSGDQVVKNAPKIIKRYAYLCRCGDDVGVLLRDTNCADVASTFAPWVRIPGQPVKEIVFEY